MSLSAGELATATSYVVGDLREKSVVASSKQEESAKLVAATARLAEDWNALGLLCRLGETVSVTLQGATNTWLVGFREGHSIAVELDAKDRVAPVRAFVERAEWLAEIQKPAVEASQADLRGTRPGLAPLRGPHKSGTPLRLGVPTATESPQATPLPGAPPQREETPKARARQALRPAENRDSTSLRTIPAGAAPNTRELRRAFIHGNLKDAIALASRVNESLLAIADDTALKTAAQATSQLCEAVAVTLSGDNAAALDLLQKVLESPGFFSSLRWIAVIWMVRVSLATPGGLERALELANQAERMSRQLDVESQIVSIRTLCQARMYRGELDQAQTLIDKAQRLSSSVADREESAETLLLQARILKLAGNRALAVAAAERAHAFHTEWSPPLVFLCQCAFEASQLDQVQFLIDMAHSLGEVPAEIVRIVRLRESVVSRQLTAEDAAEFLELVELPPSLTAAERLEELARQHPGLDFVRDALGWKWLKLKQFERAAATFEQLGKEENLSDDVLASIMLAYGYLAARQLGHRSPGAKVRAATEAAPKHLCTTKAVPKSSGRMRVSRPVDTVLLAPQPNNPSLGAESGIMQTARNIFSGNLSRLPLSDTLEFLRAGRCTGTLLCSSVRGVGAICLSQGLITAAASPNVPAIGHLMVKYYGLAESRAHQAAQMQKSMKVPLPFGTLIARQGWGSAVEVGSALRTQVSLVVSELLQWIDGHFAFEPEGTILPQSDHIEINIDPHRLLESIGGSRAAVGNQVEGPRAAVDRAPTGSKQGT